MGVPAPLSVPHDHRTIGRVASDGSDCPLTSVSKEMCTVQRSVLVTGGTGTLGRHVVSQLVEHGHWVRVLSRQQGVEPAPGASRVVGDLTRGDAIGEAVAGVDVIVHCATTSNAAKDIAGMRNLLTAAVAAGQPHLVYPSIVGCDVVPFTYFVGKHKTEDMLSGSGLPYTILRATQFHDFVRTLVRATSRWPVNLVPAFDYQPVAAREVAARLVEIAQGEPIKRADDFGGPAVQSTTALAREYQRAVGVRRPVVPVRLFGKTFAAFRAGGHLTPARMVGTQSFAEYLREDVTPRA